MPVNDSPTAAEAEVNCALCCVAGIVNSTAETERLAVRTSAGLGAVAVDHIFVEYARVRCNRGPGENGAQVLANQVTGVGHWLAVGHGMTVNRIADNTNPLQLAELERQMNSCPVGTRFVVLIINWDEFFGGIEAHWVTAERTVGGLTYTDYQLDVPGNMIGPIRSRTGRQNAPFGAPSVTVGPREAFADPSRGSNRYMALSVQVPVVVAPAEAPANSCCCCKCYITTATCAAMGLADDCDELQTLRRYRDSVLLTTEAGAADVAAYYAAAPAIVAALNRRADAAALYRRLYDAHISPAAAAAARGDDAAAYALFRAGVRLAAAFAAGGAVAPEAGHTPPHSAMAL